MHKRQVCQFTRQYLQLWQHTLTITDGAGVLATYLNRQKVVCLKTSLRCYHRPTVLVLDVAGVLRTRGTFCMSLKHDILAEQLYVHAWAFMRVQEA